MKIVVEISEKDYLAFCLQFDNGVLEETVPSHRAKIAIAKGTPFMSTEECYTGKWVVLNECSNSGYYCSNCQKKLVKEGWSNTVKKIKFCPNCGAKMEGVDER